MNELAKAISDKSDTTYDFTKELLDKGINTTKKLKKALKNDGGFLVNRHKFIPEWFSKPLNEYLNKNKLA